ncbi:MAG TPA: hydantoinase/oxoprolinase family protein [Nitrolancea sp.]|nr:hydantoinase/oxoprolinase family protein [Nitrolancea sp.]
MEQERNVRVGVDIGGTFTDLLVLDESNGAFHIGKTLTTPDDPSRAVRTGLIELLQRHEIAPSRVQQLIHGTTLVTNALIERRGVPTALLTTKGFRDAVEIGHEHRYDLYDLFLELPKPLVRRRWRLEVDERVLADGTVERPVDPEEIRRLIAEMRAGGIEAVAVTLLHSYRFPDHERQIGEILAREAPEMTVSLSSDVVPEIREYERTSTTICNVYVRPVVDRYLARLEASLRELGVNCEMLVMLSSGGICTVETARQYPIRLVESGPAAGALAAAHLGQSIGVENLFSFDMGGTTAKACLIDGGEPLTSSDFEVSRVYRFKKGSGFPVSVPVIEMIEIGAGGGSIASIDQLGLLKIGPRSAGAVPGPACYGQGGTEPTVTDADLVLGNLDPNFFLGGTMALDRAAAERAIEERVAKPLGLSITEAAWGIHQLVNENMASAARVHAIERGKDPRKYPIFAFGGAGPVHAFRVAKILHAPGLIVPAGAGVASTIGFLVAPLAFDFVRSSIARLDRLDWSDVNRLCAEMEYEGRDLLSRASVGADEMRIVRTVELRYVGQGHEVRVPVPDGELSDASLPVILESFESLYRHLYHRIAPGNPIESVSWRLVVSGPTPSVPLSRLGNSDGGTRSDPIKSYRDVFQPEAGAYVRTRVYDRYRLHPGDTVAGPAIVEERESTVVLGPSSVARVDDFLNLVVSFLDA